MLETFIEWLFYDLLPKGTYIWLWVILMAWVVYRLRRYDRSIQRRSGSARLNIPTDKEV